MAYRKRCANEDEVRNVCHYLEHVNYKWFNKQKHVNL
jgi:hypothetical protein